MGAAVQHVVDGDRPEAQPEHRRGVADVARRDGRRALPDHVQHIEGRQPRLRRAHTAGAGQVPAAHRTDAVQVLRRPGDQLPPLVVATLVVELLGRLDESKSSAEELRGCDEAETRLLLEVRGPILLRRSPQVTAPCRT